MDAYWGLFYIYDDEEAVVVCDGLSEAGIFDLF